MNLCSSVPDCCGIDVRLFKTLNCLDLPFADLSVIMIMDVFTGACLLLLHNWSLFSVLQCGCIDCHSVKEFCLSWDFVA